MNLEQCKLECQKIRLDFTDENGDLKILTHESKGFKIKIIDIFPKENENQKGDYSVTFKLEHLTTGDIKYAELNAINDYYI